LATAEENEQRSLEFRILAYLLEHPGAKDTRDGIRAWWLRNARDVSQPALQSALDALANRGWVEVRGTEEEGRLYALSPRHRPAISQFLEQES
jgi:DNA-binding MarR family transcriptional regulator